MVEKIFQENYDGKDIYKFAIKNGVEIEISTLGATLLSLKTPDKSGKLTDVLLGFTRADDMLKKSSYMGATVGRFANRICGGRFTLNGKEYRLDLNNGGKAHLHGGYKGFNSRVFDAEIGEDSVSFSYVSSDGEENYPAELRFTVKYTVKDGGVKIEYFAESDGDTLFNPTNHSYFNLNGENDGDISDNVLKIYADAFLPVDENLIPTGEVRKVKNTPFDFTEFKPIGRDIDEKDEQLIIAGGYDHNFCLSGNRAATAYSVKTGIVMDCFTDRPGVQFYSGNSLKGNAGKSVYNRRSGFCLETQFYPDSVNRPEWKSPVLRKGEKFYSRTEYRFSVTDGKL